MKIEWVEGYFGVNIPPPESSPGNLTPQCYSCFRAIPITLTVIGRIFVLGTVQGFDHTTVIHRIDSFFV